MKVLLLHISDIHFEKEADISELHIDKMTKALRGIESFSSVFIIVSGDISYSGERTQYTVANQFFTKLKESIKENYYIEQIELFIVPGNHDVDYQLGHLSNQELTKIFKENKIKPNLIKEYAKMKAFYDYAGQNDCFEDKNSAVEVQHIDVGGKKIRLNLINTALFSSRDEDQGFHYLSRSDLNKLNNNNNDLTISIMHHPHHWFHSSMKKELEKLLYSETDLLFVGHEHYSSLANVGANKHHTEIEAGGKLANRGNWSKSEFFAGVLDLDNGVYHTYDFLWDSKNEIYSVSKSEIKNIKRGVHNEYDLVPNEGFIKQFLADQKSQIKPSFLEYYVFPRLEKEYSDSVTKQDEIVDIDDFIETIIRENKIVIQGMRSSGKTLLLKTVFNSLVKNYIALFLNCYDILDDYDQTIKNAFEKIYSKDNSEYEKFKQIPKEDKIIIIDNVEEIEEHRFNSFIKKVESNFGIVIYSVGKIIELDLKERIKNSLIDNKYINYRITPFYQDKRRELVTKIVQTMDYETEKQENIINNLCEVLKREKNPFKADPEFIVQFTKYYCNNVGETLYNSGEIFSKVFESNIVSLIKPHSKKISVDKIFVILDKLSYQAHCNKKYPLTQEDIMGIIHKYNEEYDSEVEYDNFIYILTKSQVLYKENSKYYFTDKNYLAYFVAREIKRKCSEENDYSEFGKALNFACYGINSQIVLFVTYITDNINLIKMIMERAEEMINDWKRFSISPLEISFLSNVDPQKISGVTDEEKENYKKEEIKKERESESIYEYGENIYSYDEHQSLSLVKKMVRAISLMMIIARTLPSFEHIMKKDSKDKCVELIYEMPLRIFNIWAIEVEKYKEELITELKELDKGEYGSMAASLTDSDILNFMREQSIILLLNLMNISIENSARKNTYKSLNRFDYDSLDLYKMEHLMVLGKQDNVNHFVKNAISLYENQKQRVVQYMVKSIAKHYLLTSKKIKGPNIQKLNNKLWDGKIDYTKILIRKKHNEKKIK